MLFLVMFFNGKWEESLMSSHSPCYFEIKGLFKSREIHRKQVLHQHSKRMNYVDSF